MLPKVINHKKNPKSNNNPTKAAQLRSRQMKNPTTSGVKRHLRMLMGFNVSVSATRILIDAQIKNTQTIAKSSLSYDVKKRKGAVRTATNCGRQSLQRPWTPSNRPYPKKATKSTTLPRRKTKQTNQCVKLLNLVCCKRSSRTRG